jgi:exosortase E/protease (VPEID-CTERM system)
MLNSHKTAVDISAQRSLGAVPDSLGSTARNSACWRLAAVGALLIAELVALSLRFDTGSLDGQEGWAAIAISESPAILKFCIAAVAALLIIGWAPLLTEAERLAGEMCPLTQRWPFLAAHFAMVWSLALLTSWVLESPSATHAANLAWLALAPASVTWLALFVLDSRAWTGLLRRQFGILLLSVLLAVIASMSGHIAERFWEPLGHATLNIAHSLLGLVYSDVKVDVSQLAIGTSTFGVWIAPECSGFEGIGLVVTFLAAYVSLFRQRLRFPHALLLLPLGAIIIWLLNAVRVAALIAIGTSWSRDVAAGGFHSQAGWLLFNGVSLGMIAVATRVRFLQRDDFAARPIQNAARAPAYLAPFLALLAVGMITGAVSTGVDWLYPLRLIAAAMVLWSFRSVYANLDWSWSWHGPAIGLVTAVLWIALVARGDASTATFTLLKDASPVWIALWALSRLIGYVVIVPVAEELAFRGYLSRRLCSSDFESLPMGHFSWFSWIGSSIGFGALHDGQWIAGSLAGALFARALYRRGRLSDAILAHATTNALLAA